MVRDHPANIESIYFPTEDFISRYRVLYGKDAKSMTAISDMMGLVTEEAIRKALSTPNTLEDSSSLYANSIWMPLWLWQILD